MSEPFSAATQLLYASTITNINICLIIEYIEYHWVLITPDITATLSSVLVTVHIFKVLILRETAHLGGPGEVGLDHADCYLTLNKKVPKIYCNFLIKWFFFLYDYNTSLNQFYSWKRKSKYWWFTFETL